MGYTDLSIQGSDDASDLMGEIMEKMANVLRKEMKKKANEFNTPGCVNVGLVFEEVILRNKKIFGNNGELYKVALETQKILERMIEKCKKDNWSKQYINRCQKILDVLRKYTA